MKKLTYLFLALLIVACSTDDNNNVDDTQVEWLYVHTAIEANATNSTTLVIPFTEDIFAFTDRPNREHKYISAEEFVSYWSEDATNSFQKFLLIYKSSIPLKVSHYLGHYYHHHYYKLRLIKLKINR